MTTEVNAAFQKFRASLATCQFSPADSYEFLAEYIKNDQAHIAFALSSHLCDTLVVHSSDPAYPFHECMAEAYRRTFCDAKTAAKYGTENIVADAAGVAAMLAGIAAGMEQFSTSDNPQQSLDMAYADTKVAH